MKYLLMAYTSGAWADIDETSPEFQEICEFYERLAAELTASGELVLTEGLADPALSRTLRKGAGGAEVVDGPFAESKEIMASLAIVDVVDHERAMEIAARIVDAVGDTIELRPIMQGPPAEL
jgi:hypothetical protein